MLRVNGFRSLVVVLILLGAVFAPVTRAQPLADRLPSDAILYVGWAGVEKLGPAYSGSHLKGVMDASNLPELFTDLFPKIARRLQLEQMMQGDPVLREIIPTVLAGGEAMWQRPSALYVGPIDLGGRWRWPGVRF